MTKKHFKKHLKRVLLFAIIMLFASLISFCIGYYWVKNYSWHPISSEQEMRHNGQEILNSPALPDKFYQVYDLVKPYQRLSSMNDQIWFKIMDPHNSHDCKCDDIGYLSWNNHNLTIKIDLSNMLKNKGYWYFGFGLEKYSTPKKCFDYWINNDISWGNNYLQNLNELSLKALKKEIKELDENEILLLMAWFDARKRSYQENYIQERFKIYQTEYLKNQSAIHHPH